LKLTILTAENKVKYKTGLLADSCYARINLG